MMRVGKYIARDHESARYGMESESIERLRAYICAVGGWKLP